jgi:hypothetical protein
VSAGWMPRHSLSFRSGLSNRLENEFLVRGNLG